MTCNRTNILSESNKENIIKLYSQRSEIEKKANSIIQQLTSGQPPMGINDPLVDKDGYPRADIDVYKARHLRNELACLRTDYKEFSTKLEISLLNKNDDPMKDKKISKPVYNQELGKWILHVDQLVDSSKKIQKKEAILSIQNYVNNSEPTKRITFPNNKKPFAVIDEVTNNSPSHKSGIQLNDLLVKFGPYTNVKDVLKISELVLEAYETRTSIPVELIRNVDGKRKLMVVYVVPEKWEGKGLLGCHIQKYVVKEYNNDGIEYDMKVG